MHICVFTRVNMHVPQREKSEDNLQELTPPSTVRTPEVGLRWQWVPSPNDPSHWPPDPPFSIYSIRMYF